MSKAILVFDSYETLKKHYGKEVLIYINIPVKSRNGKIKGYQYHSTEYAILKPMPQKKDFEWTDSFGIHNFKKGFNDCIDEILGDEQ